ncbi:MAG: fructose-bisphosphatase class II [Thiotrichales bacterium]|nr:MAG: fructose-bisphosphatase class II [Thiotrichales bacterium]
MQESLILGTVRATEEAARSATLLIGKGDKEKADQVAVNAMRTALNSLDINGTIVIGEGERDEAPMLYIGEKVGKGGEKIDIALDPLEGTTLTSKGGNNALTVIAMAKHGCFLNAPDVYMQKIAVGGGLPQGIIDLDKSITENLQMLAKAKQKPVQDLTVCILERPRHQKIIDEIRTLGASIKLISDGDVFAVIATSIKEIDIDLYIGTGGAPEGVLAAAALRCLGGQMQARLIFRNDVEKGRANKCGITDFYKKYTLDDLAKGDVIFAATGVTDGDFLRGVKIKNNITYTHSIVMDSASNTVRYIENRKQH